MDIINNKVDDIKDLLINDILDIVKIPSVKGKAKDGFPFGEDIANALNKALAISKKLGFETKNLDNYIGYADYGKGDDYICIIGHIDVVEEGDGWKYPPYGANIENGNIYARGILDNKGPIISALYALYIIKELGFKLNKKIRIIFGTDEESGFSDVAYYLKNENKPLMGFTPDCKYPVVYGEKGMARFKITTKNEIYNEKLITLLDNLSKNIIVTYKNISIVSNNLVLDFKVKYDFKYTLDDVLHEIKEKMPSDISIETLLNFDPVYFDKESKLVKSLQIAYERVTNLDGTPVTTNGGTYAKVMPNIVPFGPSFPGQRGISHNKDEYMSIDDIILNTKIFANAIYELAKED